MGPGPSARRSRSAALADQVDDIGNLRLIAHTGTHIDALSHFGLDGRIWNGFHADQHQGDVGWKKGGAEQIPPIVARGVLIDVAAFKGVEVLPESYRILPVDLEGALARQGVALATGDAVLIRTGRMRHIEDARRVMDRPPDFGASLKLRGASGAPMRPIALPLRPIASAASP